MLITCIRTSPSCPAEPMQKARLTTAAFHPINALGHTTAQNCVRVSIHVSTLCSPTAAVCNPIEDIWTIKNHEQESQSGHRWHPGITNMNNNASPPPQK